MENAPFFYCFTPFRRMMSTTFLVLCCWTWSPVSSTPSWTPPTPTYTTRRTSTCRSMAVELVTTGPVASLRYSHVRHEIIYFIYQDFRLNLCYIFGSLTGYHFYFTMFNHIICCSHCVVVSSPAPWGPLSKLELNSAGQWPSRTEFGHPWHSVTN